MSNALLTAVRAARHVAVLTGAGISAESGIPTFRDALTGLWSSFRAEDLATPEAFAADPARVYAWYSFRRQSFGAACPNPGHVAIAALARIVPRLTLVTQNIDGLHQAAGSPDVIELHGSITRDRCSRDPGHAKVTHPAPAEMPPACAACGAPMRPDVVWFGELLPADAMAAALDAARDCDAFLSVGTSNVVYPAAALPWVAGDRGVPVVIVNPDMAEQRRGPNIHHLVGQAGTVLPALLHHVWPEVS